MFTFISVVCILLLLYNRDKLKEKLKVFKNQRAVVGIQKEAQVILDKIYIRIKGKSND